MKLQKPAAFSLTARLVRRRVSVATLASILVALAAHGAQDVITIDLAGNAGAADHKASGQVAGITQASPADRYIAPLKHTYFRAMTIPARPDDNPFNLYPRLAALGVQKQLFNLYTYVRLTDPSASDPENWRLYWTQQITAAVQRALAEGKTFEWEPYNEPDLHINPSQSQPPCASCPPASTSTAFNFADEPDWFSVWDSAFQAIRAVDPAAIIHGPSYGIYNEAQMKRFIDHCAAVGTMPNILNWHYGPIDSMKSYADTMRAYAASKGYTVSVVVGETIESGTDRNLDAGLPVHLIANAEKANVHTIHTCWSSSRVAGINQGQTGELGGLLTHETLRPRGVWWTYKSYADMAGTMLSASITAAAKVNALASKDSTTAKALVLIGARDEATGGQARLRITNFNQAAYLKDANGLTHIKAERIPFTEAEVSALPVMYEGNYLISAGDVVELPVPVGKREAVRINVSAPQARPTFGTMIEAESLAVTVSAGDSHTPYNDAFASGGAVNIGLLGAVGDWTEYTLPIAATGTYQILVGIKAGTTRGIAQLSIGGVNIAAPFDGFASAAGYTEMPVGLATFNIVGNKLFRLTITGKNESSTGYQTALDYIRLVRVDGQEAEVLPATVSVGDTATVIQDPGTSGGSFRHANLNAVNDYIEMPVDVPAPGMYAIKLGLKNFNTRGRFVVLVNGAQCGDEIDGYSAVNQYTAVNVGLATFELAGPQTIRLKVTGKNPSSTGYGIGVDYFKLSPSFISTVLEAENLSASITSPDTVVTTSFTNATNGKFSKAKLSAVGSAVTYTFSVAETGSYYLTLRTVGSLDGGKIQVSVDSVDHYVPLEIYNCKPWTVDEWPIGVISLAAGSHTIRLTAVGQADCSSNYYVNTDAIRLTKVKAISYFEAESLASVVSSGDTKANISDPLAMDGIYTRANVNAVGDIITFTTPSLPAGVVRLEIGQKTDADFGLMRLQVDGTSQGLVRNCYSLTGYFINEASRRSDLGSRILPLAGAHAFTFVVTGKDAASAGHRMGVDYMLLTYFASDGH